MKPDDKDKLLQGWGLIAEEYRAEQKQPGEVTVVDFMEMSGEDQYGKARGFLMRLCDKDHRRKVNIDGHLKWLFRLPEKEA